MSKSDEQNVVVQDTAESLGHIRDSLATTTENIVSAVLDIQGHALSRNNWINSLECLRLDDDRDDEPTGKRQKLANGQSKSSSYASELLERITLNPLSDSDYVAVSYTWAPSEEEKEMSEECQESGRYFVESREVGQPAQPSLIRNLVWERALQYAGYVGCDVIWIDRECIEQEDSREKETAIQNMHLVYYLSQNPVALLTHAIKTVEELDLLVSLLLDGIREEEESAMLDLLDKITSDLWWRRAWTFQEDYRASIRMTLLFPHTSNLENRKRNTREAFTNRPLLGTLPGEICVNSAEFRRRATRFCLVYRQNHPGKEAICDKILAAAGKYDVLLQEEHPLSPYKSISRSMTPTIFADIGRRGISSESDRLAIAANCCGYTTRLNTQALNKHSYSLSLSMLTLYFLNGEIIKNDRQRRRGALKDTVFAYLAKQSLRDFRPPVEEKLTFIKSCRFVNPILTYAGTLTRGHLWRLGKLIRPRPLKHKFCTLSPLEMLATDLQYSRYGQSYKFLAANLLSWIHDVRATGGRTSRYQYYNGRNPFSQPPRLGWRTWMTDELEAALREGKALRLASLVDPNDPDNYEPYSAIFIDEDAEDWTEDEADDCGLVESGYVFTSVEPARDHPLTGDSHKHVSLEVELEWPEADTDSDNSESETEESDDADTDAGKQAVLPRLYIKRWVNGLCFWEGCPQQQVLFPWPADLLATS
ncbi:heterokaryon incompatibility protein-domain-containing protein [Xylaria nigripes]|nr:heterokaryon incompatibility protein-domain-containing protein [Xylaria nigripes]